MTWGHRAVVFSVGVALSLALTLALGMAGPAAHVTRCQVPTYLLTARSLHSVTTAAYPCTP